MQLLTGRCGCGALTWACKGPILWSALCHCEDCRRAASADYVSWLGVPRGGLRWRGPQRFYRSSANVMRSFCNACGAAASFETSLFPNETHLYAASLDDPSLYRPTAHIFWSERRPWVQFEDSLPKHAKGLQDAAIKGRAIL